MKNPEADKARALATACRSLEKASRGSDPEGMRAEALRIKTVLAMSELLDEFGLTDISTKMCDATVAFRDIWAVLDLHSSENRSIKLYVLNNGEIELCSRSTRGDHVEFGRRGFGAREVQVFYEHMLFLLGYELPGSVPRELPDSQPLRFHKIRGAKEKPWILASLGSPDGRRLSTDVELSQTRAVELCQILAEPLGWELEG